jgi:uncharacterized protein YutE (UPF0331/DUF86 family)
MATYRNLLSHEYHGITDERLFALVNNTGPLRIFVHRMQDCIRTGT